MLIEAKELFEPYTKDGCTLELFRNWLMTEGKTFGFDVSIVDLVLAELLLELKNGRSFLKPCNCGCPSTNVHTYINHYAHKRCREVQQEVEESRAHILEIGLNKRILGHIHEQNEQYLMSKLPNGPPKGPTARQKWRRTIAEMVDDAHARESAIVTKEANLEWERVVLHEQVDDMKKKLQKLSEAKALWWKFWR